MRLDNSSGRILTIFLVVIAVLLVCLTGISLFFWLKEIEMRETAEYNLEQMELVEKEISQEVAELKKKNFILVEKNKESESELESVLEELDLERGLREEMKKSNRDLRDQLGSLQRSAATKEKQLEDDLTAAEETIANLQDQLDKARNMAETQPAAPDSAARDLPAGSDGPSAAGTAAENPVKIDEIVVTGEELTGAVVSIDHDTEFLIISLGEADGLKKGTILAVYRGESYLGDVKVSRVLPQMAAADFLPPLSSQDVVKDDRVVVKNL